jgi:long-subunit acyl-CoA synthetase (AMP-forming)/ribosomal protein S18 acetylase RimI-like enzyme
MEGLSGTTGRPETAVLIERLRVSTSADDAAETVSRALAHAAAGTPPDELVVELDRAAVLAVRDGQGIDEILERLDPDSLAALLERVTARAANAPRPADRELREAVWAVLDLTRRPALTRRIDPAEIAAWSERTLAAVEVSDYTVGPLFRQRAESYGSKVLFQVPGPLGTRMLSWRQTALRVEQIARALLSLDANHEPAPIAILSDNRIEMALVDLACLTSGLVNVMVPANATEAHVGFILRHARVRTVIVSDEAQLRKVTPHTDTLPELQHVIAIDPVVDDGREVVAFEALLRRADRVPESMPRERADRVRAGDLATVMYTSGTTGTPKGIRFSHLNLVFKRFARGLALPEIGDHDVFLCFLPLFHTFGRFLEMLGCVFWGASYCFLENPAVEALIRGMRRFRPTVFISVPKKWMQLHEAIAQRADPVLASDEELLAATRETTGGRLRWGLSAAGHLASDVFLFFQRQGIELMSGFGMTEGTGGITMTPPGRYRENSLGIALPGIELELAADGELCVRGPFVMMGYLDPPEDEPSFDENGWLHTGDLMVQDSDGYLRLVDRKKEIYKNIKGETIAPQRVENMFRDFESVARAFLVGDHREYNTLLIYPNHEYQELDFRSLPSPEVKDHFRSLVVSVNKFLAPFERIVDFAVIDRDLDPELGELTPKGTPRRRRVVENFSDVIRQLYRRTNLHVGGLELTLPNWLLQTVGLTAQDIRVGTDRIMLPHDETSLSVRRVEDGLAQIGSCRYSHPVGPLNLGALLSSPRLWLGNEGLVGFVALDTLQRQRAGRTEEGIGWGGRVSPYQATDVDFEALDRARDREHRDLIDLHCAAKMLAASDPRAAIGATQLLESVVAEKESPLAEPGRLLLTRAADSESPDVARRAFQVLVPAAKEGQFKTLVERFLDRQPAALDAETRLELSKKYLPPAKIEAIVDLTLEACKDATGTAVERAVSLLRFLSAYGASHPASFRRLRGFLVRMNVFARDADVRGQAAESFAALRKGFRSWLGSSSQIAVDPETGQEYRWDDVIVFDEQVPENDCSRILSAIKNTPMIREASFLFSKGVTIRLDDIPPGGVWIRLLGARHGKAVYRVTIQTRFHGGYELAINLNHSLTPEQVEEEIRWLLLAAGSGSQEPLVEDIGGYWPEQDLWSEEFISGETLDRALRRLSKRKGEEERFKQLWPFLAWTALSAYVDFWHRTGGRWEIADPDMTNVVVPTDDYHTGVRIVSVSARRPHRGLLGMMRGFMEEFIEPAERQYPTLENLVDWDVVFSAVLEIIGEEQGLELFHEALESDDAKPDGDIREALNSYVDTVSIRGFLPRRLFFAVKRYRRWAALSSDATPQASARTLQELYDTYGLQRLAHDYPETRVRFFRETVFREGPQPLLDGLDELIGETRSGELVGDDLIDAVAELRARLAIGEDDDYFLARISLPYLRPEDAADFVSSDLGGRHQSEIVVTLEDHDGRLFRVRHALNPKEVGRLLRLFQAAKLDVRFRPEHRYLVAINDRQQIIGGIYYEVEESGSSAHLEKIVVAENYRRKGVADGLMNDFFNRLRAAGLRTATTGFFRPGYFYTYGFRIEKRYAGLVKSLNEEETG